MIQKYLRTGEQVLRTRLRGPDVPPGKILVKLREHPTAKPVWRLMNREDYQGQLTQTPPSKGTYTDGHAT